jgi:hypothetical protein
MTNKLELFYFVIIFSSIGIGIGYILGVILYKIVLKTIFPFLSWIVELTFCKYCRGIGIIDFMPEPVIEKCEYCRGTGEAKWVTIIGNKLRGKK